MARITLLVVDDIEMNRSIVRKVFMSEDYRILEASNGKEAMEIVEKEDIEILITDIFMEPMNGYELITEIRSRKEYRSIPIIAITESDQASRKKALKAGADDLIYKPFISGILLNRVKGLLFDGFDLKRYQLAYENNPIPFILYHVIDRPDTPSYKILYMNRAARSSYSPPFMENLQETDESPEYRDLLLSALRNGDVQRSSTYLKKLDRWLDWTFYPDGSGIIAAMIHDITGEIEKQTAAAETVAERAIAAKNSMRELVENIPSGIFVFSISEADIEIVEANTAGCKMLHVDHARTIGVHQNKIFSFVHPEDSKVVLNAMHQLLVPETTAEYRCRIYNQEDHSYVWFAATAFSKEQPDHSIFAYISYRDITNEMELAETRSSLIAEKKAALAKTAFMSRVSHDMRTPLNGILGVAHLLMNRLRSEEDREDLRQMQLSGEYLLNLVKDTLDAGEIETGKLQLHPVVCDGRSLFNNVIQMMRPAIKEKQIRFTVHAEDVPFTLLYVDNGRVEQIAMNILQNAVKYTPVGGSISLSMENVEVKEGVITDRVIVKDTGIGISKEFLPHVFEPFSKEEDGNTDSTDGAGLGLTIAKEAIEQMGGTITVDSEKGNGTTVTFTLVMPIATDEQIREYQLMKTNAEEESALDGKHILMCEDHPLNAQIATRLLTHKGAVVTVAVNGQEGFEIFEQSEMNAFDAILMDIRMPVMDGLACARAIRALNRVDAKTIPIIAMTANAFEEDRKLSREAGMDAHLSKPINPEVLYSTLEAFLTVDIPLAKKKVLIVDDVEMNRAVLRTILADTFHTIEAENGEVAWNLLNTERGIDAVITDIVMPVMDGEELIRKIRGESKFNSLVVLANTQYGDPSEEERLLELGINDFIYKPSSPRLVKLRVMNALKRL